MQVLGFDHLAYPEHMDHLNHGGTRVGRARESHEGHYATHGYRKEFPHHPVSSNPQNALTGIRVSRL